MQLAGRAVGQGRRRIARGVALIEAIIAMVVLSVGLLGLAVSQTRLLADSRSNAQRATAIWLTDDLANRMIANRERALIGGYDHAWNATVPTAPTCGGVSAPCTAQQQATADLNAWLTTVERVLPGATATVFRPTNGQPHVGIAISWVSNESTTGTDLAAAVALLNSSVNANGITCPANRLCHLTYVHP